MSFYALVMQGKVLGFRENTDEESLALAERTALVLWDGDPISIYEVEGAFPACADRASVAFERYLIEHPELEPVSVVDAEAEGADLDPETTGAFVRVDGEPGESGFFASVG